MNKMIVVVAMMVMLLMEVVILLMVVVMRLVWNGEEVKRCLLFLISSFVTFTFACVLCDGKN